MRTCFQIVNAYLYLSATDFLQVTHTQMITAVSNFPLFMMLLMHILFFFFLPQSYAESLCRSFCDLLKDITNEGQVQVLKVLTSELNISRCQNSTLIFVRLVSGYLLLTYYDY